MMSIKLELNEELVEEHIISKYVYDVKTSHLVLEFNDEYKGKTITSPLDLGDWNGTIETFRKHLASEGISEHHIRMVCNTADNNAVIISEHIRERKDKPEKMKSRSSWLSNIQMKLKATSMRP